MHHVVPERLRFGTKTQFLQQALYINLSLHAAKDQGAAEIEFPHEEFRYEFGDEFRDKAQ